MKKLLIISFIFLTGFTWTPEWEETECFICGKTLYYESSPLIFDEGMVNFSGFSPGEEAITMSGMEAPVCHACYEKYWPDYREYCVEFWKKARKENDESRKLYDAQREIDKINENTRKIKKLQEEIEALKK